MLKKYSELTEEEKKKVSIMYSDQETVQHYLYNFDDKGQYHGRQFAPKEGVLVAESTVGEKVEEVTEEAKEEVKEHFEYFLKALDFAAPPHGGLAIGIERMLAVFLNLKNLKETIAFPKNIDGTCSLTGAPNYIKITNLN